MPNTKELEPITQENALVIFTGEKLDDYLKAIQEDVENFVGNVETATGRKQIASKAYSIAKEKTNIDTVGKALVVEWKEKAKLVDASRKKARDFLDSLKEIVREPLTNWEIAEEKRKEAEALAKEILDAHEEALSEDDFFNRQKEIERKEAEFKAAEDARIAKENEEREAKEEKELLEREKKERIKYEAKVKKEAIEAAELEKQEAIKRVENEATEKIEAEKQAKIKIENDAKEAAIKAEAEKYEAVQLALKKEETRKVEEKRKADTKAKHHAHQKKINREALESYLAEGVELEEAKKNITMIAQHKIKNITINY